MIDKENVYEQFYFIFRTVTVILLEISVYRINPNGPPYFEILKNLRKENTIFTMSR